MAASCGLRAAPQLSGGKRQPRASARRPPFSRHGLQIAAVAARDAGAGLAGTAAAPPAEQQQQQQQQQQQRGHRLWRSYPHINRHFAGLELIHEEPPVYIAHGFLSPEDCEALRRSAEGGELPRLEYDNAVLVDTHRLWPLLAVVLAGAAFDTWHSNGLDSSSAEALLAAAGPALLKWGVAVGGLLAAALAATRGLVGGRVFTGTKWTAADIQPGHPAAPMFARFLHRTSQLLEVPCDRLEPPTVTRYLRGQYQRLHFDARPAGDPAGLKQFLEAGGQRLVQVVVYLNSLQPDQGGETRFFNPLLKGLAVQPRQGDALIFFPAFADGRFDDRMAHAGMPVKHGSKWICNTWVCERAVPASVTHLPPPADEQQ